MQHISQDTRPTVTRVHSYIPGNHKLRKYSLLQHFYIFLSWQTYISGMNDYHYQYEAQGFKVG